LWESAIESRPGWAEEWRMIPPTPEARRAFILEHTRLQSPPHTPELQLHLADEITPIWRMTEEALAGLGLPPPFWAFAWAGGQALARYILDNPDIVAGKAVIDFASGSGLVAIAAKRAGAIRVLAADIDAYCGGALELNAAANAVAVDFTGEDLLDAPPPGWAQVILAGDICYEKPMAERTMAWLAEARAAGATVLIGDPGRSYFPRSGLTKLAEYQVQTTRELEDQEVKKTCVWTLP
jgi:predicted nicotinamide N-methyase